jgi:hypothetical protein
MPVLAAGLTDVVVGYPHPAVALGRGGHRLHQAAILLLDPAPASKLGLRLAEPGGKRVTHALQLGNAEHARSADRAHRPLHPLAREGGGE